NDLRAQTLEWILPAVFPVVELRVAGNDPAEIASARSAQDVARLGLAGSVRRVCQQLFDCVHGCDDTGLLRAIELVEHRPCLLLRALLQRRKRLASALAQSEVTLASILCRGLACNQAALLEIAQKPAEIAGIEVKRTAHDRGCDVIPVRDLV